MNKIKINYKFRCKYSVLKPKKSMILNQRKKNTQRIVLKMKKKNQKEQNKKKNKKKLKLLKLLQNHEFLI